MTLLEQKKMDHYSTKMYIFRSWMTHIEKTYMYVCQSVNARQTDDEDADGLE